MSPRIRPAAPLRTVPLLTVLLCSAATAAPDHEIHWAESYEAAFEEANDRGVPLCLVVIQDREEANEDVWANTIQTPDFIAAMQHTVNVIGNRGKEADHGSRTIGEGRDAVKVCAKFGGVSCIQHAKMEVGIFRDFAKAGQIRTPLVIVALPDQTVIGEFADRNDTSAYLKAIEKARGRLPNGLDWDEAEALKDDLAHARGWLDAGEVEKVIGFARPLSKRESSSRLIARAVTLLDEVGAMGREELADVERRVDAKEFVEAMTRLDAIIERYGDSDVESDARKLRTRLSRDKDVKAALQREKKEQKADELLQKADDLRDGGKEDAAQRIYDSILVNFADTRAAATLRERGGS